MHVPDYSELAWQQGLIYLMIPPEENMSKASALENG